MNDIILRLNLTLIFYFLFDSVIRMVGKNSEDCHSCRLKGHFFGDCSTKRTCPWCNNDFQKCFQVERDTANKGKFFNCCSQKCGFWEWCNIGESSGESSDVSHTEIDDVAHMF